MKELLEKIGSLGPTYLRETLGLFSGPKRFMSNKLDDQANSLSDSLIFMTISVILSLIMLGVPLNDIQQATIFIVKLLVELTVMSVIAAWSVWLSWRAVGGMAPVTPYIVIYCYYSGIAALITGITLGMLLGVVKTLDSRALEWSSTTGSPYIVSASWFNSYLSIIYFGLLALGGLGLAVWGIAGWGAYRQLNGATRLRSAVALVLTLIFGGLLMIVGYFLGRGME